MYKVIASDAIVIAQKKIVFPCSIMKDGDGRPFIVEKDGLVIVNFYPDTDEEFEKVKHYDFERNVWAFNANGELVWIIHPPVNRPHAQQPYLAVFERDGNVFAGCWSGQDFIIDLKDGTVSFPRTRGRPW